MIHLIKKVYLDYQFSNIAKDSDVLNVYVGGFGESVFVDDTGIGYSSFNEVLQQFGSLTGFVRYLLSFDKKVVVRVLEEDMLMVYTHYLLSVNPDVSRALFDSFARLQIINYKMVHSQISNYGTTVREQLYNIALPTREDLDKLYKIDRKNILPLNESEKIYVSFEYLLANMFSTNFDEENIYNKEFIKRTEFVVLKSVYWDYVGVRRDMLYGLYNIKKTYGYDLDLESPKLNEQFEKLKNVYLFDIKSGPSDVEHIKEKYDEIIQIMSKHNSSIGDTSFDIGVFARDYFDENMQLNMDKVKILLSKDREYPCSQIFGRTEFRFNMNNLIIGMIYSGKIKVGDFNL